MGRRRGRDEPALDGFFHEGSVSALVGAEARLDSVEAPPSILELSAQLSRTTTGGDEFLVHCANEVWKELGEVFGYVIVAAAVKQMGWRHQLGLSLETELNRVAY